ncbi:MAG: glycoside-pentoside-hexuronide (GPH):cation symporter [Pseudolysinimonas sp.]|uniref:glycoside-pentoside-hexuronide (GPH):cation symporter n=1 Tax=Pseudolysinimonas sp. TaxID=2680009 RepID=UPI003265A195
MISWNTKLAYGVGALGSNIIYGFVVTYLAVYYTDVAGIAAGTAAILFLVVRSIDALLDPVMGLIVDRTKTRWGRFRPYLLVVPPILTITTVLAFSLPVQQGALTLGLAYLTYLLWSLSYTATDVPYWSMSAVLTMDARDRTSLVMVPRTLASVGAIGVNIITLPLVVLFASLFAAGQVTAGWQTVALLYGVVALALIWVTFFRVREPAIVPGARAATHYGLPQMLRLFASNRPLQLLLVTMLFTEAALTLRSVVPVYYMTYNFGSAALVPAFLGIFAITAVIGSLLSPLLARLWGKRRAAFVGIALTAVTSVGAWLTGYSDLAPILAWIGVAGLGFGVTNIALVSMLSDTVEFGQWRTGRRTEGLIFSSNIFKSKVASALGTSAALALLAVFGYVAGVPQNTATQDGIHLTVTLVPGIIGALGAIPLIWYRLDEKRHGEIVAELETRETV